MHIQRIMGVPFSSFCPFSVAKRPMTLVSIHGPFVSFGRDKREKDCLDIVCSMHVGGVYRLAQYLSSVISSIPVTIVIGHVIMGATLSDPFLYHSLPVCLLLQISYRVGRKKRDYITLLNMQCSNLSSYLSIPSILALRKLS
ncbi:hypothetical protein BX666DRAFT_1637112 [Dichotomocladium elegans]|nr:hypothetical protein BX666DRAFT_1637112 [Dichotomocladium elegans]